MIDPDLIESLTSADEKTLAKAVKGLARERDLTPYKDVVLGLLLPHPHWIVRSQVCLMLPKLRLRAHEVESVFGGLREYLRDRHIVVRVFAMQAMFDLSDRDSVLRDEALSVAGHALSHGTAAQKARARKLLVKRDRVN